MSEMSVSNPSVAVSVVMRLWAALRTVGAVSVWVTFDEISSAERFVGVENCDWSAWREFENETPGDRQRRRRTAGRL